MNHTAKIISLILGFLILAGCSSASDGNDTVTNTPGGNDGSSATDAVPSETVSSSAGTGSPEVKEITIEIEGERETMTVTKYQGKNFCIYYDAENFTIEDSGDADVSLNLTNPNPELYPDIALTISFEEDSTVKEQADALLSDANSGYEFIGEEDIGGLTAQHYHAIADTNPQWNSVTSDVYFIGGDGGCFTIAYSCYLEAAEGWGARLGAMVGTFSLAQ